MVCASVAEAQVLPITLTKVRDLNFGFCDSVPGTKYTVAAADLPGAAACTGAYSGRYLVQGDANARITIDVDKNVTITNGTDTLTVKPDADPLQGNIRLDGNGQLTIYVGGEVTIPNPGGVTSYGLFSGTSVLTVDYK
jgi:hypothetical protein